jgi:hypothetical protein
LSSIVVGWNFSNQNLTGAHLIGIFKYTDFSQANLTNANLSDIFLNGANLSGADTRGAINLDVPIDATSTNLIYPDGHIAGLDLTPATALVVQAYAGDPSRGLGPIPVTVQNHVSLGNDSALMVGGGTLRFTITSGTPTIGTGVIAVVSSGATLELAGSVAALASGANCVNITNNSTAPGILVSGTHQKVGTIDGTGTTQVNAGSDLEANRIVQSALMIGGTAGSHSVVTIAVSDASGNPLGQSNGLALVGSLAPSDPIGADGSADLSSGGGSELVSLTPFSSVGSGNPLSVPEPSTLLLVLLAITVLAGKQIVLRESSPAKRTTHAAY